MHLTAHEPIAFQAAQGLGEHLLRDAADLALQFGVAPCAGGENVNDERGPFVRDPAQDDTGEAMCVHDGSLPGAISHPVL